MENEQENAAKAVKDYIAGQKEKVFKPSTEGVSPEVLEFVKQENLKSNKK